MRVLHISRYYHPYVGGVESFIASLASSLGQRGIESRVLVTHRFRTYDGPEPRIPVTAVPAVGPLQFPVPRGGYRNILREFRMADVVHVHDLRFLFETALALCTALRKPLVVNTHGLIFHTERNALLKRALWRRYYVPAFRRMSRVIADSEQDLTFCRESGIVENLTYLPVPVAVEPFLKVEHRGSEGGGRLLYFGRLAPNKGIDRLAPVLAAGPPGWTLTLAGVGDESYTHYLRSTFAGCDGRVEFVGSVSDETLRALLAGSDCVILPSRSEGFGITLVEAMAAGVPVVASRIPTYTEIGGPAGIPLVDFDDPESVVTAISRAWRDYDAAAARARAGEFSWGKRAEDFVRLYREVGGTGAGP